MPAEETDQYPSIRELNRPQRRVLGVLLEKGFTTPDQYPLTVKSCTSGCNQKSNRDPVSNYSEDQVLEVLDELQQMGLVACVHTESGRTERYRHYMRKRFTLSEPQLAILTELLLRGRQSVGELRGRASRMIPIESLEDLRQELQRMIDLDLVTADDTLDRRGVEVDHNLYPENEKRRSASPRISTESDAEMLQSPVMPMGMPAAVGESPAALRSEVQALRTELQSVRGDLALLQEELQTVRSMVDEIRRDLGG